VPEDDVEEARAAAALDKSVCCISVLKEEEVVVTAADVIVVAEDEGADDSDDDDNIGGGGEREDDDDASTKLPSPYNCKRLSSSRDSIFLFELSELLLLFAEDEEEELLAIVSVALTTESLFSSKPATLALLLSHACAKVDVDPDRIALLFVKGVVVAAMVFAVVWHVCV